MKKGDLVRISGAAGTDIGQIVHVLAPQQLPRVLQIPRALCPRPSKVSTATPALEARKVLAEWHVERVAIIEHRLYSPRPLSFAALRIAGRWFDLQRNEISIEPAERPAKPGR